MAYKDIFDSARSTSTGGNKVEKELPGYIPRKSNELISVPPHDPFEEVIKTEQDPKIVRETAPQADIIFNFMGGLNSDIKESSDKTEKAISDPSSVVKPGSGIMSTAQEVTDKVKDATPSPSDGSVPPAKAKDEKPENWGKEPETKVPENNNNKKK